MCETWSTERVAESVSMTHWEYIARSEDLKVELARAMLEHYKSASAR
jgi:hypothetical protein